MCATFAEHEWALPKFLESGKSPTLGRYNRFLVRCTRCDSKTTQTEWLDLSDTISRIVPVEREGADGSR